MSKQWPRKPAPAGEVRLTVNIKRHVYDHLRLESVQLLIKTGKHVTVDELIRKRIDAAANFELSKRGSFSDGEVRQEIDVRDDLLLHLKMRAEQECIKTRKHVTVGELIGRWIDEQVWIKMEEVRNDGPNSRR